MFSGKGSGFADRDADEIFDARALRLHAQGKINGYSHETHEFAEPNQASSLLREERPHFELRILEILGIIRGFQRKSSEAQIVTKASATTFAIIVERRAVKDL